ncbi:MAG: SDR family NAD(P)-dependent oxidoreductase [Halobacteriaceae archaeon]
MREPETRWRPEAAIVLGAGPGLGQAVVKRLAVAGVDVAPVARSSDRLQDLAATAATGTDAAVEPVTADATASTAPEDVFETVADRLGTPDLLVCNLPGPDDAGDGVGGTEVADLRTTWELQVATTFRWARALADRVAATTEAAPVENTRGALLATSSGVSRRASSGDHARSSARFGLRGLSHSLADELGPRGLHVCHVVIDGWIDRPDLRDRYPEHEAWMAPPAMAETLWRVASQPGTAWTTELDLRSNADDRSW